MMNSDYKWNHSDDFSQTLTEAVLAGNDLDDDEFFVARIQYENNHITASFTPNKRLYLAFHEQQPVETQTLEFLTGSGFFWSDDFRGGNLPENAVPVGTSADGTYLFIGRTRIDGMLVMATICPHLRRIQLNCDFQQNSDVAYQALCHPSELKRQSLTRIPQCEAHTDNYQWVSVKRLDPIPSNALLGGVDCDTRKLYVARFWINGEVIPGKIIGSSDPDSHVNFISGPFRNQEIPVQYCQILTGTDFRWQACENDDLPYGAVQTGETKGGEGLFVGRGHARNSLTPGKFVESQNGLLIGLGRHVYRLLRYEILVHQNSFGIDLSYEWITCNNLTQLPHNVVKAGLEVCVGCIAVGESRLVGSVNLNHPSVFTKSRDTVLEFMNFQVLAGTGFRWSKTYKNGQVPKDAVPCGRNMDGEMCFIGRKTHENIVIVGEISTIKRCMFLVHNSKVVSVEDYEVLQHPNEYGKQALSCIPLETNTERKFKWVAAQRHDTLPEDAIMAGWGLYVGRFWSAGEVLSATIIVHENMHISKVTSTQNNKEISTKVFQILTGTGLSWQPCHRGQMPQDAIETGKDLDGAPLLIGRAMHYDSLLPGIVNQSNGCIYLAWDRRVINKRQFEVLVENENSIQWVLPSINQPLPEKAVFVGLDTDGSEIFVGRLPHDNMMLPANVIPRRRLAVGSIHGNELESGNYEILVGTGFSWVDCINGKVPADAIKLLTKDGQEDIYIGRVQNNKCLKLGRISPGQRCLFVPHNGDEHRYSNYQALVKLTQEDQATKGYQWIAMNGTRKCDAPAYVVPNKEGTGTAYVGRLFHEGEFLPAEVPADLKVAIAVYKNSVITSTKFEVLTGTAFSWEQSIDGGVPSGAIVSGKTKYGEWLLIGRAEEENNVRIGKVHPTHGRIYVPHYNKAKTFRTYEVLVQKKLTSTAVPMVEGETSGKCCVCRENEAIMAVVPCGNLCLCCQCCENPSLDKCPVCRGPKLHCIRIFKS